ncbi:hypothetical protein [Ignicoccus hospitalis]|uniref:Lipoprotein n=1 Tax=Ignicoccus hospitalis (strain KIN4/I / DSM 18386 / JCM 14125) TaxID=453591 RepID=A8AA48_IGNH4|nr:hypothetical protein [Ignicoccus hospitalis]ABU81800.1 hypothetical protein Igni_0618 [Ignicoccus hospitalis KIN4/I]HIH90068.1 hypothetical protein [Desulfurococcaceae archaeon]
MRKAALLVFLLVSTALSACNLTAPLGFDEDTLLRYDNMIKGFIERIKADIITLRPENGYQKALYKLALENLERASALYSEARSLTLRKEYDLAMAKYLATLYFALVTQDIIGLVKVKTFNELASYLDRLGAFASSSTFSLYKSSCMSTVCTNSTRVVYIKSYLIMKNVTNRINSIKVNLPPAFTVSLARELADVVADSSKLVVLAYTHFALSYARHVQDSALEGSAPCGVRGLGSAWWLPKACYHFYHSMKPSPCSSFYGVVSEYIGLKDLAERLCGVKVG